MTMAAGHRLLFSGVFTTLDAATAQAFVAALLASQGLTAIGAPLVRNGAQGIWACQPLEQGVIIARKIGDKVRIVIDVDGPLDRAAVKTLVDSSFGLVNPITVEDTTDL